MPDAWDAFVLNVIASVEVTMAAYNVSTGTGETFEMGFWYTGGINPTGTGFQVFWYNNQSDADAYPQRTAQALSPGSARAPSGVVISPRVPVGSADPIQSGTLSGRAPALNLSTESRREIHGRLEILQAALNA